MTAQDLIRRQTEETGFMLNKVVEGLDEAAANTKHANLMSPKETMEHLAECYLAAEKSSRGEKHDWGSYRGPESWEAQLGEFRRHRQSAIDALLSKGDDEALWHANEFIVGHDHYHVGQLCAMRLALDEGWDPYGIYR